MPVTFDATLELGGRTATGIAVPTDVLEQLGGGRRPKVVMTIREQAFRTSVGSMNGRAMLPVNAGQRATAGVEAGDELTVTLAIDDAPRTVEVPDLLAEALAADPQARTFFDSLSYTNQRWHAESVAGARRTETQRRRVEKSLELLRARRAR